MSYDTVVEDDVDNFKVLTPEEAGKWRASHPSVSLWGVVVCQVFLGCMAVFVAWLLSDEGGVVSSVLCGAFVVVFPSVVMVSGLSLQGKVSLFEFFLWEFCKIILAIAALAFLGWFVVGLNWLALLVGMVMTMKAYWIAPLVKPCLFKLTDKEKS